MLTLAVVTLAQAFAPASGRRAEKQARRNGEQASLIERGETS